jgi:hypothetical protein
MRLFALTVLGSTITAGWVAAQARDTTTYPGVQDHKMKLTAGTTLHFADTFIVARKPDGKCDWSKTPAKPGKPGTNSVLAEASNARCWGVVWNVTFPPHGMSKLKPDTAIVRAPKPHR